MAKRRTKSEKRKGGKGLRPPWKSEQNNDLFGASRSHAFPLFAFSRLFAGLFRILAPYFFAFSPGLFATQAWFSGLFAPLFASRLFAPFPHCSRLTFGPVAQTLKRRAPCFQAYGRLDFSPFPPLFAFFATFFATLFWAPFPRPFATQAWI